MANSHTGISQTAVSSQIKNLDFGGFDSSIIIIDIVVKGRNSCIHREFPRTLDSEVLSLWIFSWRIDRNILRGAKSECLSESSGISTQGESLTCLE